MNKLCLILVSLFLFFYTTEIQAEDNLEKFPYNEFSCDAKGLTLEFRISISGTEITGGDILGFTCADKPIGLKSFNLEGDKIVTEKFGKIKVQREIKDGSRIYSFYMPHFQKERLINFINN